jgi:hypothetical protein
MSFIDINRRRFLHSAAAGAATGFGMLRGKPSSAEQAARRLKIVEPFHGAVLNHRHGRQTSDGLAIRVSGEAPANDRVTINGAAARREGDGFSADIVLKDPETDIVAASEGGGERRHDRIRVVWDRYSKPRYRFSIDDNSFFLRDIAQKKYASLFDCFYLNILRDLHRKYGAKFSVNIYYETGDDFNLTQFPDRYKPEWRDNADWMKLAFHAHANDPDRPYQDAPPEKLIADLDQVAAEIHRFAGEEVYAPPTVIHWGMTRQTAFKPLYNRGVRALSGYFSPVKGGGYDVNYLWDDVRSGYLSRHDAWKDFESGIVFSRVDIVVNNVPIDQIVGSLEPLTRDPNTAEIMDIFTHEQYFWPFYRNYVPDHAQRLDTAIRWVTDRGYAPVLLHEGLLGGRT